ncbi:hypothetical protein LCGC14_2673650, partial [marine sediment metagenome]
YKEDYLDIDKDGRWSPRKAGERWDWKASLEKDEIKQISKGTYDIAKVVGKPVQVMWFVGIPDGLGHPDILPWYISTEATPDVVKDSPMRASLRSPLIRRLEDMNYLARTSAILCLIATRNGDAICNDVNDPNNTVAIKILYNDPNKGDEE